MRAYVVRFRTFLFALIHFKCYIRYTENFLAVIVCDDVWFLFETEEGTIFSLDMILLYQSYIN